jgi:hypothetical protein
MEMIKHTVAAAAQIMMEGAEPLRWTFSHPPSLLPSARIRGSSASRRLFFDFGRVKGSELGGHGRWMERKFARQSAFKVSSRDHQHEGKTQLLSEYR